MRDCNVGDEPDDFTCTLTYWQFKATQETLQQK